MLDGVHSRIEIFVSDNASSDETSSVARSHRKFVKYVRQEENLGFLGNIDFLAKAASADFVWFLDAARLFLQLISWDHWCKY